MEINGVKTKPKAWYKESSKTISAKRHLSVSQRLAESEDLEPLTGEFTREDLENLGISTEKEDISLFD